MSKPSARPVIRLRGVRHNNLKNFDLDLPLNQLIVITGLSGSGKSSLAFDTLFAEGQRRYIETFSPYARQFFDRMDKPQVDSIEGIPPAIAIEQRNAVKTTRSTVGTMTEICDYMKMLWPHIAQLYCRQCGRQVRKDSPQSIWQSLECSGRSVKDGTEREAAAVDSALRTPHSALLITFDLPLSEKLSLEESLPLVSKQGYQRLLVNGEIVRMDEALSRITHHASRSPPHASHITVIQDRLQPTAANRARFTQACEQAYHFGKGKLAIHHLDSESSDSKLKTQNLKLFSNRLHCAECDIEYHEPSPALFSFNHPVGACPTCRGFGRIISIDYSLALPDRSRTLAQGVVKPWQTGLGRECQSDLLRMCRHFDVPVNVPFEKLSKKWQDFVIQGEPGYGKDEEHQWPRAWYGIKGYFRWLESKAYKMHVRVLLSRYRAYTPCPDCCGQRFQPEALLYRAGRTEDRGRRTEDGGWRMEDGGQTADSLTLADFYQLPIRDSLGFIKALDEQHNRKPNDPLGIVLNEVRSRLGYLAEVGLGYLTLDRPTRSLSGGETERVNLTTCLGSRLVNTLFVLDEPSVGLHPRDTQRLVSILQQLRQAGNTVVVVEHEPSVMLAADQIVDLGPGHGATGGQVVFQGTYPQILSAPHSLTGEYLSARKQIAIPQRRPVAAQRLLADSFEDGRIHSRGLVLKEATTALEHSQDACPALKISKATCHNLKELSVEIPLGRLVCITGVSGSGKTTLVREILLPTLADQLKCNFKDIKASDRLPPDENGEDKEQDSALVPAPEPSTSGRTPRSALLEGSEHLGQVILVDQSILGKTPRSNPAVYIGAFDDIREFYAQSDLAKQRGLNASAFSFNSSQGQCERCHGAGFEKIEMQFLSDVFIRCPDCQGRRYRSHILEIRINPLSSTHHSTRNTHHFLSPLSIADLLEATIEEAISFLSGFPESRPARRAVASLKLLEEVGLGYLRLGQPINTLSGGESQRLKLVKHLAEALGEENRKASERDDGQEAALPTRSRAHSDASLATGSAAEKPTLFLFDEPTTGLHFDDVRVLLRVFQRLVDAGHSILVIEHNLEVIKSADWIMDLGPDAGDEGGRVVTQGTPEDVASCSQSHTGRALRSVLPPLSLGSAHARR